MPQITPIRGFTNTPVSKSICVVATLSALMVLIFSLKPYVKLAVDPFIVQYNQYWRVATFQLAVVNESDYMLTTILWFHFKVLERFFGLRKYLLVIAVFAVYNAVVTFLVLCVGQLLIIGMTTVFKVFVFRQPFEVTYTDTFFNSVSSGPFGVIALLYMCHGAYIPVSYQFKILMRRPRLSSLPENEQGTESDADLDSLNASALTLTNNFQVHVLFTILMFNHGLATIIPCLVGLLIGRLYTQDLLAGSKTWAMPLLLFRMFVSPRKLQRSAARTIRRRFDEYRPVSEAPPVENSPPLDEEELPDRNEEDDEVAIDDIRSNEDTVEARSATPVRPLGRQFLDTFRA